MSPNYTKIALGVMLIAASGATAIVSLIICLIA